MRNIRRYKIIALAALLSASCTAVQAQNFYINIDNSDGYCANVLTPMADGGWLWPSITSTSFFLIGGATLNNQQDLLTTCSSSVTNLNYCSLNVSNQNTISLNPSLFPKSAHPANLATDISLAVYNGGNTANQIYADLGTATFTYNNNTGYTMQLKSYYPTLTAYDQTWKIELDLETTDMPNDTITIKCIPVSSNQ